MQGVWKRYHGFGSAGWILKDIDLTIPVGLNVGIIGRNGAGKSTLLRLIAGNDSPDRGNIERQCRVSWPIGLGSGFQPTMTGRQNARFVASIHGSGKAVEDIVQRVIDFAEIGDAIDRPIRTYSAGMRARINFGMSLALDFDIYLSDEATAVGDTQFKKKASRAFKEKVGKSSLIIVSHQEGILKDLCQAGAFLTEGRIHWFEDIDEALYAYKQKVT